jgi:hypothetical protein
MMRYGQVAALCASLLPLPAFAQGSLAAPDSQPAWTTSASLWLGYNCSFGERIVLSKRLPCPIRFAEWA